MGIEWKTILGAVAPRIAGAIGGPLAGTATKVISRVLLGKDDAEEAEIAAAMATATPEQLVALKNADKEFEVAMAQINADDRADARLLARVKGMWPQICLSIVYIVGFFGVMGAMLSGALQIEPTMSDILKMLIGALTVGVTNIMQFWFGSSFGSKAKDGAR